MGRTLVLAAAVVAASGCYHITVVTGAPESANIIDRPWQLSLVSGLVPPPEIDAGQQCTRGVAKVETERSFLNSLVGALSSNIITPMHTKVTCAGSAPAPDQLGSDATAPDGASPSTTGTAEPGDAGAAAGSGPGGSEERS